MPRAHSLFILNLVILGIDPDFGVKTLQEFVIAHPEDKELQVKMHQYTACAQVYHKSYYMIGKISLKLLK